MQFAGIMLDFFVPAPKIIPIMNKQERLTLIKDSLSAALQSFCRFLSLRELLRKLPPDTDRAILAIGKDAGRMLEAALKTLSPTRGKAICLTKYGYHLPQDERITCLEAGHPVPDANTLKHSRHILNWLKALPRDSELIVLLSGGGSALFEVPKSPYSLDELSRINKELLTKGLNIKEMNRVRATYSEVKAGEAARHFSGKKIRVYALSDVANDDPNVISSGPFTTEGVEYQIIGNNYSFRQILKTELEARGFEVLNLNAYESSDLPGLTEKLTQLLTENAQNPSRPIILGGGEVPIQVSGKGLGGRCTHLALSMAPILAQHKDALFVAFATDGSDNLSNVAGAWVDSHTLQKLQDKGIDLRQVLQDADSYTALNHLGQAIESSEYHANVNDVYVLGVRC